MQSLCAAHLEEKHQWGPGIGVEDDLFITNEEWTSTPRLELKPPDNTDARAGPAAYASGPHVGTVYVGGSDYTGIPAHVVDLATQDACAPDSSNSLVP